MKRLIKVAAFTWFFLALHCTVSAQCHGGGGASNDSHSGHSVESVKQNMDGKKSYTCSMHPEVVSPLSGKCPKCGMVLEHKKQSTVNKCETKVSYSCSRHQDEISDIKGKCTVCGKKLKRMKTFSFE